eukprot:CAMPEP_0171076656 /NCGR_PEP_ID=MMETSP0766_2-20121228/13555_1 /TAXON_ID=439317 /ORGANISM="Gambierdiscus australes, Strain CAWD 149" /LENGTH=529 /DNA_ID=CAMNT_0011533651 /DNA_START=15 /DNA_END=1604 /DNA_ORIENTATION=+
MAGRKVFVGSLPINITDDMLRTEFGKYGQVTETFVKPGCEPGRQWAFVTFATPEQAQFVKETCDRVLVFPGHDRPCDVMLAKNQGSFSKDTGAYDSQHYEYDPGHQAANGYAAQQAGMPTATGNLARKVFVGSLPDDITDEALRAEFSKYGVIDDVFVKPGCEPGRQWAFVNFQSPEQAVNAAQACNGILHFPGAIKPCEVTLARNQGMFGQDPIVDPAASQVVGGQYPSQGLSEAALLSEAQLAPRKIFVGSLPDGITDPVLRAEFSKYGQVVDLFMKTTCETNRQWAFVTFANSEQAQFARNSCDKVLTFPGSDRPCEVTMARHQGMFGKDSIEPTIPGSIYNAAPVGLEGPRKVFVGSLPDSISDGMLRAEFSKFGQIMDLYLKTTCEPGRQWAFITFASSDQAAYAKDATDRVLKFPGSDRTCEVMLAKNQGKFGQAPLSSFGAGGGPAPLEAAVPSQPPPPATPPPAHLTPWRMYRTASGLPYYHNSTTGVTQWEPPPDFQIPGQQPIYAVQYNGAASQRYSPY